MAIYGLLVAYLVGVLILVLVTLAFWALCSDGRRNDDGHERRLQ